jgi:toxin-antitoxin system PIN domain toxin
MTALLDANVLIALFDGAHLHHRQAHEWLATHRSSGWATCPLTQNACLRIISQPAYPGRLPVADIARRLHGAISVADHQFWPDDVSLCDPDSIAHDRILSPRHLTDLYLLALAVKHNGRLVTFDRNIPFSAVPAANERHWVIL